MTAPEAFNGKWPWCKAISRNAFCLPGGEIVVYTEILPVTQNEAGLATVLGHEIAHATSRHGAQRIFQQNALQIALSGVQGSIADLDDGTRRQVLGLLGAGAQYGVLLPFSRQHELEADQIGLKYMARAAYDPHEALAFWRRMMETKNGQQPPELMSTHPADSSRISQLENLLPGAMEEYQKAIAGGSR
jgi:metalloendopeptidase OMA1, mitochondrial